MKAGNHPGSIGEAIAMVRANPEGARHDAVTRAPSRNGFALVVALFTCLFLVWFMFAADLADAVPYKGKTKGGSSITLNATGKRVTGLNTVVPTICLQSGGSYGSSAGAETYRPRRAVIGRTVKSKALQPAAMHFGVDVTKFYEVKLRRKGRVIVGKLRLSYSYFVPDLWNPRTYICSGSTTFTARPR